MALRAELMNGEIENVNEEALRSLIKSLPAYLYSVHFQNGVTVDTMHSHQCEKVTGYKSSEYVHDPDLWFKMVHPADQGAVRGFFSTFPKIKPSGTGDGSHPCNVRGKRNPLCVCNDQYYALEHRIIHKNGMVRWIENRFVATYDDDGSLLRLDGLVTNITERKATEEKLVAAKEEAEAATLMKDKFISLVSHDIRSPLATIIMFQKVTMSTHMAPQCEECKSVLGKSVATSEAMLAMADNLLESARLHGGNMALNRKISYVKEICITVIADLSHIAEKKGIALKNEVPDDARIYVDRALIVRVVHNLVVNALKFSNKNDVITIFLSTDEKNNILAVKDTGVGIDGKLIPDLFKYEIKTSTAGTFGERGTGLGLPISMDIVKAHGGTIEVTTQKGEGSIFHVKIPVLKPVVLVADDDEVSVFTIRRYIENMGAEVITATNGTDALKLAQDRAPALILADIKMPLMDGFELLRYLKSHVVCSRIPVIIITGSNGNEVMDSRKKAFECNADDFVTKPLVVSDFIPRIGRFIGS